MSAQSTVMELVELPENQFELDTLFIEGQDIAPMIDNIRELATDMPTDMAIAKNRKTVAGFAYKIRQAKSAVEKAGKGVAKKYKDIPKAIDAHRRQYKEAFNALEEDVRGSLNAWEQAEAERKQAEAEREALVKARLDEMTALGNTPAESTASEVQLALDSLNAIEIYEEFGDLESEALRFKEATRMTLAKLLKDRKAIEAKRKQEEQQREEAERKALEERVKRETEERMQQEQKAAADEAKRRVAEAERQAKAAAEAAERAKAERAKADAEAAKQHRKAIADAVKAAAEKAERENKEARQREEAAKARRREDKERMATVNRSIVSDLVTHCGIDEDTAKSVVIAIARGNVANVSVDY